MKKIFLILTIVLFTQTINAQEPSTELVPPAPIASTQVFCSGATVIDLTAIGANLKWYTEIGGMALENTLALTSGTYYVTQTENNIESVVTSVEIVVNTLPIAGTISGGAVTVCESSNATDLSLNNYSGDIQWQKASSLDGTYATIDNATSSSYNAESLIATTYFRASLFSGVCATVFTDPVEIIVSPIPVAKTITGASPACIGESKTLTYETGSIGTIQWEYSTTSSSENFNAIVNENGLSYTATNLQVPTWFRVMNTSGVCDSAYSEAIEIVVNALPIAGTISGGAVTVCESSNATDLSLNNYSGDIQWQKASTLDGIYATIENATSNTFNTQSLNATTYFRASLSSGFCATVFTDPVEIIVSPMPIAKTITGASPSCIGESKTLTYETGSLGTIQWEYSTTSSSENFNPIENENGLSYTATNLQVTTWYRVTNASGACDSAYSEAVEIVVNERPIFTQVAAICSGEILSELPTTSENGISGAWTPELNNLATTTYTFRSSTGICETTATMTIVVKPIPSAPIMASSQSFCTSATVASIIISDNNLKWYAEASGGNALATTTALVTGTTYHGSQTINGCESSRTSVVFTENTSCDIPVAPTAVSPVNLCYNSVASALTATPISGHTLKWYSSATSSTPLSSAPIPLTTIGGTKSYYVSQVNNTGNESPRVEIQVIINGSIRTRPPSWLSLTDPASPSSSNTMLGIVDVSNYVGTDTPLTLTATSFSNDYIPAPTSYKWVLPEGVNIVSTEGISISTANISVAGVMTTVNEIFSISNEITINFLNVPQGFGNQYLRISVFSVNGCSVSMAKVKIFVTRPPRPPMIVKLLDPVSISSSNTMYGIRDVGPYIGTETNLTLSATSFVYISNPTSYKWILPAGVNVVSTEGISESTVNINLAGVMTPVYAISSTSNEIIVNFFNVPKGFGNLQVGVCAANGAGNSTAKILMLMRRAPRIIGNLTLTDPTNTSIPKAVIRNIGSYIGTEIPLTLSITPQIGGFSTASSYKWVLPEGVNVVSTEGISSSIIDMNIGGVITPVSAISSTSNEITVNFSNVVSSTSIYPYILLPIKVYASNGAGDSTFPKILNLSINKPYISGVISSSIPAICSVIGTTSTVTYSIPHVSNASSTGYNWAVPDGATIVSGQGSNTIEVSYASFNTSTRNVISVTASNLAGISFPRTYNLDLGSCRTTTVTPVLDEFKVVVYPNPFTSVFKLEIQSSSKGKFFDLQVYDLIGRLIEQREVKAGLIEEIGSQYTNGIYNFIITQGDWVKSFRVIKQ